jgi:hypothetical protein
MEHRHGAWGNEITNSKHQITNKSQIPIFNDQNTKQVWDFNFLSTPKTTVNVYQQNIAL